MFVAFLQILFDLSSAPVFGHFWVNFYFHVDFRIYLYIYSVIFFDHSGCCQYDFSPNLTFFFLLVRYRSADAPKLLSLLEHISYIYEISWSDHHNPLIAQINDLGIIIGRLYFFVVFTNVWIKTFLHFEVVQQWLISFIWDVLKLERVNENVGFFCLRLFAV